MIRITNTENNTGVTICGDFYDLYNLVEALHEITISEYSEKHHRYIDMSTRVLGVCYDIRHAYQGDRDIELLDNQMDEDKMKWHSTIVSRSNVYYKCNCLYPEMFFVMLALNELVELRIMDLTKKKYVINEAFDKNVVWDSNIAIIRTFQADFAECVKSTMTPASFSRWLKTMNSGHLFIEELATQYIDVLNIKYLRMNKEKRLKSLLPITKRIAEYTADKDHKEINKVVVAAAKEYNCPRGDIRLTGIEYPEEIIW